MKRFALSILLFALSSIVLSAQRVNAVNQINWAPATGQGAPTAYCPAAVTGNTVTGSPVVTNISAVSGLLLFQAVTGTGVPSATTVLAVDYADGTATLSQNATATGTAVALSFYSLGMPYTDVQNNAQYVCSSGGWVKLATTNSPLVLSTPGLVSLQETLYTPASSSAACVVGQFTDDDNYHYVCVAANTWKRAALTSF